MTAAAPTVTIGAQSRPNTEVRQRAERLATGLKALGVEAGGSVALLARNDFVCLEANLAVQHMDAYVVTLNWHWQAAEIAYVLRDCGARAALVHHDFLPMVRQVVDDLAREDPARRIHVIAVRPSGAPAGQRPAPGLADEADYDDWLATLASATFRGTGRGSPMIYTSGTTGRPKAVKRMPSGDAEVLQRRELLALVYGARPGGVALVTGPLYHLFSQAVATIHFGAGASVVIMERFEPELFLQLVQQHRVTMAGMVPTMFVRLLRLPEAVRRTYDVSSLQLVAHSAAPCPPDVKRAMIDWFGPVISENYGSSETGVITLVSSEEWLKKPGTVGRPALSGEVRIYSEDGQRLGPHQIGDVYLKMHGSPDFVFHGHPEARAKVDREGFVTPGDIGYLDEDGYLFLCDRRSQMIIRGGVNIYPQEIESVLLSHPQVVDCAVFGIPDDEMGERVTAHIQRVPGSGLDAQGVLAHLSEHLAKYKLPQTIVFEPALPRQDNGKIYKQALREPYWAGRDKRI